MAWSFSCFWQADVKLLPFISSPPALVTAPVLTFSTVCSVTSGVKQMLDCILRGYDPKTFEPRYRSLQSFKRHYCSYGEALNGIFITKLWNKSLPTVICVFRSPFHAICSLHLYFLSTKKWVSWQQNRVEYKMFYHWSDSIIRRLKMFFLSWDNQEKSAESQFHIMKEF